MKEYQLSIIGKSLCTLLIVAIAINSLTNIFTGKISNPYMFFITLVGFLVFLYSKFSVFRQKIWLSFGTEKMTECMANCYRVGYWLMVVGILLTF